MIGCAKCQRRPLLGDKRRARACAIAVLGALSFAVGLPASAQEGQPSAVATPKTGVDQIVVTGQRPGEQERARPDDELSAADISTFGADRVGEVIALLNEYEGEGFSLLINGRRLAAIDDILELPPEALAKIEILSSRSGAKFGLPSDRRVLNIVVKNSFRAIFAEASVGGSTDGGAEKGSAIIRYTSIVADHRLSASFDYHYSAGLLERDRFFATDATLARSLSLIPAAQGVTATAGYSQPLGEMSINLSVRAATQRSDQRGGLTAIKDGGSDKLAVLHQVGRSDMFTAGATLGGTVASLSWSLDGRVDWNSPTVSTAAEALGANGESPISDGLKMPPGSVPFQKVSSERRTVAGAATIGGAVAQLPAGAVTFNIRLGGSIDRTRENSASWMAENTQIQRAWDWRINAGIPLIRGGHGLLSFLGDLSVNGSAGIAYSDGQRAEPSYDGDATWSPVRNITFNIGYRQSETFPSADQLFAPLVSSTGVLVFDPVMNAAVGVSQLSGGNLQLKKQTDITSYLRANFHRRLRRNSLSASANYLIQRTMNPVVTAGAPGTAFEAVFPDRFIRDDRGVLQSLDSRPFNAARRERNKLIWNIHVAGEIGPSTRVKSTGIAGPRAARWDIEIAHEWLMGETMQLRSGIPPIDLLVEPLSASGMLPSRHIVRLRAGFASAGVTTQIGGTWHNATSGYIRRESDLLGVQYSGLLAVNCNTTLVLGHPTTEDTEAGSGMRIKVSINNLLNARPRIYMSDRTLPLALQPKFLDPLGRTVSLSLRKAL